MDYREARAYIEEQQRYGGEMSLGPIRALLEELGHPERCLRFIHIAGTNGKGSILSYISTALTHAGYRVGRYISPTLYSYRERFQVNGSFISREEYVEFAEKIRQAVENIAERGGRKPSPFELETVLGFLYFRARNCDLVVLECGMGGRDDATNVIPAPELCVFASISLDHTQYLGGTLEEIAAVKAGILKEGTWAVMGGQKPEASRVLEKVCLAKKIPFFKAEPEKALTQKDSLEGQVFLYHGYRLEISLAGSCQKENAVTAFEALKALQKKGWALTDAQILEGIRKTLWQGRFTKIWDHPLFYVDGAHNPDAADKLRQSVRQYFAGRRLFFIIGVLKDKDYRRVVSMTAPLAEQIFTIETPDNDRALPAEELAEVIAEYNPRVAACQRISDAVEQAYLAAGKDDVILAFGSLSFLGELTRQVSEYRERMRC